MLIVRRVFGGWSKRLDVWLVFVEEEGKVGMDSPVTPCVKVHLASVLRLPRLTVVTFAMISSFARSFAQRKHTSSSGPSPATMRKSTGDLVGTIMGMVFLRFSKMDLAAVPLDQSIGSTITAPERIVSDGIIVVNSVRQTFDWDRPNPLTCASLVDVASTITSLTTCAIKILSILVVENQTTMASLDPGARCSLLMISHDALDRVFPLTHLLSISQLEPLSGARILYKASILGN